MPERRKYKTRKKEAVQAFFMERHGRCFTAEEVYIHLGSSGMEVGKATVYRSIIRLCEEGTLRRYAPPGTGDAAYYQYNPCGEHHLHIRCLTCGGLAHVNCEEAGAFCRHIASHHGFAVDEGQTILVGRCKQCGLERHMRESAEDKLDVDQENFENRRHAVSGRTDCAIGQGKL